MSSQKFAHPTIALAILLAVCPSSTATAQQRRPTVSRPAKNTTPTTAPTFETLLAKDSYKIYGEIRGVGQLIQSNSVSELLEPVIKLAAPPKEFTTLLKWLHSHADAVMTSRMLVATSPTTKNVPDMLVAIEFGSPEDATRFEPQLNDFLPRVLPTPTPNPSPTKSSPIVDRQKSTPPSPNYYVQRAGSLIFITSTPLVLKNLRPTGSKLLTEDANFRVAHDRFTSEPVFVFVDLTSIQKEEEEQRKEAERAVKKREAELTVAEAAVPQSSPEASPDTGGEFTTTETKKETLAPDILGQITDIFGSQVFSESTKWPEALGIAVALDNESLDARVLLVNSPGEKSDPVPFMPILIPGPAITPESPSILPADTELLVTMSLDMALVYAGLNKPTAASGEPVIGQPVKETNDSPRFASLEKKLGINIKNDLLPLLGNEVVFSMPITLQPSPSPSLEPAPEVSAETKKQVETKQPFSGPTPVIALALRDKEGMHRLLPKIIDSLGFQGASAFGQAEKRGDSEIVSYGNAFAYAFVGDFLVVSTDVASTRHVVDSYLKGETLSSDQSFRNYTRWQPRQLQGQVYISPALMESYKTWAREPSQLISEQTREFFSRLTFISQPVTYALSNDGLGTLHEVHIPKNLVLMAIAGMSGESNPPPMVANERSAMSALYMIASAEAEFKSSKGNGQYCTLDQLMTEKDYIKKIIENNGYKIELTVTDNNHFEVSAVPVEYGKTGRMSYYVDETNVVRSADHAGGPATVADRPVH
ncbi:MAG: hypothetical protein C5B55_04150 [Blastocatellia bacterium]|nr:MAG: hypothetical protein C5B55_04150 [Blastocatellia bacterium]